MRARRVSGWGDGGANALPTPFPSRRPTMEDRYIDGFLYGLVTGVAVVYVLSGAVVVFLFLRADKESK